MTDGYAHDDDCDLCEAARITEWFHEDDICWIAECEICAVPMVVWRGHGIEPPAVELDHMHTKLAFVISEHFEFEHYVDDNMRNIPDHYHAHGRPVGGFFGHGLKRKTVTDAGIGEVPMRGWGLPDEGELERIAIVSPHLDDAVLGCGNFMAAHPGAFVVTVFAGNPPEYPTDPMRKWDVQSGFSAGDDVMEVRRHEDDAALEMLAATPIHLEFVEHSYLPGDRPVAPDVLAAVIAPALAALAPTVVLAPFGLANPDHDVTHRACMLARERLDDDVSWWCYEDHGYKHIPGMLAWRVSSLFRHGLWPTPVCPTTDPSETRKQAAIACYPSQLLALEDDWAIGKKLEAPAPEQFWRLAPPPPGWERLQDA